MAKRPATYVADWRWKRLEDVETTGWEDIGELSIDPTHHDAFLRAFGSKEDVEAGGPAHPGVITCLMLGALRNAFPVPVPDTDEPLAQMHTGECLEMFSSPRVGDTCQVTARMIANVDDRLFRYEGWLLSLDGVPLARNTFEIRMLSRAKATAK